MIHKQAVRVALIVLLTAVLVGMVIANYNNPCREGFRFEVRYDLHDRISCANRGTY